MPAALVEQFKLEISGNDTFWSTHPLPAGRFTLWLHFPTGVSGTLSAVLSRDPTDPNMTAAGEQSGSQVTFTPGTYRTKAIDVSGGKFVGITGAGMSGGSAYAYLDEAKE